MIIYADTSALTAAYLHDRADHADLSAIVYDGLEPVVTSALTDVEIASAIARAGRGGVIDSDGMQASIDEAVPGGYLRRGSRGGDSA